MNDKHAIPTANASWLPSKRNRPIRGRTKAILCGIILMLVLSLFVIVLAVQWGLVTDRTAEGWHWLQESNEDQDSNGETLRNLAIVLAAGISGILVAWRNWAATKGAQAASTQAEIAKRGVLNDRYHKGVEMLGSDNLVVRIGGTYMLMNLAREHPKDHLALSVNYLCDFARNQR